MNKRANKKKHKNENKKERITLDGEKWYVNTNDDGVYKEA